LIFSASLKVRMKTEVFCMFPALPKGYGKRSTFVMRRAY
jgi:hypothetical protein